MGAGQALRRQRNYKDWLANFSLDFDRFWALHRLTARALGEWQHSRQTEFGTLVKGFTNNATGYHNLAAGALRPYGGTYSDRQDATLLSGLFFCSLQHFQSLCPFRQRARRR